MFLSFSKFIGKGKFKIGAGLRLTKQNMWYMLLVLLIYWMIMLTFYMMAFCVWLTYAMFYGIYWCIKKIVQRSKKN